MRLLGRAEHALGLACDALEPQRLVGLLDGERFLRCFPARQRSLRHDQCEDFVLAVAVARKRIQRVGRHAIVLEVECRRAFGETGRLNWFAAHD
jgi:hypothetical protein